MKQTSGRFNSPSYHSRVVGLLKEASSIASTPSRSSGPARRSTLRLNDRLLRRRRFAQDRRSADHDYRARFPHRAAARRSARGRCGGPASPLSCAPTAEVRDLRRQRRGRARVPLPLACPDRSRSASRATASPMKIARRSARCARHDSSSALRIRGRRGFDRRAAIADRSGSRTRRRAARPSTGQ